jgi:hypothetical protein
MASLSNRTRQEPWASSPVQAPNDETGFIHVPIDIVRRETGKDERDGDDGVLDCFGASFCICLGERDSEVDDGELWGVSGHFDDGS